MTTPKMLLFDIDGTLLHTGGAGRIAIEKSFEQVLGVKDVWGNTVPDGKTDPMIFQEIIARVLKRPFTDQEFSLICDTYIHHFKESIQDSPRFRIMPGIPNLLKVLSEESHLFLGIQTGNFEEAAWLKLEKAGIRHHFHFGGFGSDSGDRAELVAKGVENGKKFLENDIGEKNIFVIGDSKRDIEAAKKLNLRSIAVKTGHADKETLSESKPDFLLEDLSNPTEFLEIVNS